VEVTSLKIPAVIWEKAVRWILFNNLKLHLKKNYRGRKLDVLVLDEDVCIL